MKTNNSSGGVFYKNGVAVDQFFVADLRSFSVYFVDDGDEQGPQFDLSITDGSLPEHQIDLTVNYIPVNDAPLLPSSDHHINLRGADSVVLTENMLGVIDPDTAASNVTISVSSIAGLEILRSNIVTTSFTLADVQAGIIRLNNLGDATPLLQLSVNDGASDDQVLALQFNELDLLSEITLSATVLGNGRSQIEISGLLDAGFAPHSTLQVSTNDGQSWQTIEVNPNLTYVGGINYQDARWANENFNYASSWAGTGFGLSGTQRGAPENISIGEIEGRTALTFVDGPRDAAWYAANPGASTANVYKNQDGEGQDDFFWYQPDWHASDRPYFSAHIYKPAGNVLAFRIPVLHADSDGTGEYRSYPAIWIHDSHVALRAGGRYDIGVAADAPNDYVGWLTAGLHVSADGDLHYFLAKDHVENVFTSEHLITTNKMITDETPGYGYDVFPIVRRNDATVMVSNVFYNGPNAIQDLSYSKQLNDASWSITDAQDYGSAAQLDYSFRILDVNGNVQERLNYDSVNVQNLVDNGDIVLTDNGSLYRDSAVMSAARDPEIFQIVEGQSLTLSAGMLGVDHHTDAALLTISGVSGGIFYRDDVAVEHFSVEDLRAGRVSFVDDDNEQAPQIVLTIKEAGQPARDINLSNPYVSVNDAPLVPDNDQHINLRNSDQVTLTASILGVSDPDTNSSAVVINVISIAGLDIKLSDASVTFFTLADVERGHVTLNKSGDVDPTLQLSVNDGASSDQVVDVQFNELGLLNDITVSARALNSEQSQIEISGLLDSDFAPHSTLQVSTNDEQTWQTIEVDQNLTLVGGVNYQDARWVNEDFNYANGWAGTGFGLSGTQRGAPENISIGEIEGRTALTYTSGPRDAAWYAANPGASTANVYKNQDGEIQDDFFWYQSSWTPSDKPYFSAHVYKGAGSTLGFRLPVKYEYSDGNLYDSWPAIWIYDNSVKLRGPNRYDISLPPVEDNEYVGWLTVGIHVSTDGDLHYFLAADHVENVFTSEHLLASNKALTAGYDGFPYAFWPVARQNDATVMISNLIYGDGNAIQDLSYSKQLNDASWSISDTQTHDNDAQLNYSFRILDVNGNVQEQLNYDSVNVQNLVDNGDIVLTENDSLYRDMDASSESASASNRVATSSRAEVNPINGEILVGTDADDVLLIRDLSFVTLDGGLGTDTLRFDAALTVDFRDLADEAISSIEVIDIANDGGDSTLAFDVSDVLNFSETTDELIIQGKVGDTVDLANIAEGYAGAWVIVGGAAAATIYSYVDAGQGLASVIVDDAILVNVLG